MRICLLLIEWKMYSCVEWLTFIRVCVWVVVVSISLWIFKIWIFMMVQNRCLICDGFFSGSKSVALMMEIGKERLWRKNSISSRYKKYTINEVLRTGAHKLHMACEYPIHRHKRTHHVCYGSQFTTNYIENWCNECKFSKLICHINRWFSIWQRERMN